MFASHAFLPATSDIPLTLDFDFGSLRKKNWIFCFGGKKIMTLKGWWLVSPRGTTTGFGRERVWRERYGSHKRSRNYSRKLRERTPLVFRTFQYLGGIFQDISVSHFDSRRSLSLANRQRSTSLIFFVNFTQPCDHHDRKIRTIRKSDARWRGRRVRNYRKLIWHANLLYVPNIKM